jgi:RNA polymerase sigma-70 factor (ECF subfamily)
MQTTSATDDSALVEALRRGDERAFETLVDNHSASLLRVALTYVHSHAVAEEVVQETWLGVLNGIDRFEGRSSLKTWIFRILTNTAQTRGGRERRSMPFSSLGGGGAEEDGPSVDPDRFLGPDHGPYPGHWALGPTRWEMPEERLMSGETREVILAAIEQLPPSQRAVITLRDVEGWPSEDVCDLLELTDANQRVLLHRARTKIRAALERHLAAVEPAVA